MALTNDAVIAKTKKAFDRADAAIADLKTNGGYLNPERRDTFIREVTKGTDLLPLVRTEVLSSPEMYLDRIGMGSRLLHKGTFQAALDPSLRAKPDFGQVKITTELLKGTVYLGYEMLEDNIEKERLSATVMALIIQRVKEDLEEVCLLGDTTSSDSLLKSFDGWMKRAAQHTVDYGTAAPVTKDVFKAALLAMPSKYLRNRSGMAHFVGPHAEIEYADSLTPRNTALGDSKIVGSWQGNYAQGVPVRPASIMPESKSLFTDPKNLIVGIHRNILIEVDKDIEAQVYKIVVSLRVGTQIDTLDAIVRTTGLDSD